MFICMSIYVKMLSNNYFIGCLEKVKSQFTAIRIPQRSLDSVAWNPCRAGASLYFLFALLLNDMVSLLEKIWGIHSVSMVDRWRRKMASD